jgi:presequence protease
MPWTGGKMMVMKRQCGQFRFNSSFCKVRQVRIDELGLDASEYKHLATGARYFHLEHSSASAFSIAFRTLPRDSRGAPHILEHTVLCGSQRFPVRDPFFKMLNRSLAVYMNAWTGADFTQYPFVTENVADYGNLRGVYLDAVFRPLLAVDDFLQEGWRLTLNSSEGVNEDVNEDVNEGLNEGVNEGVNNNANASHCNNSDNSNNPNTSNTTDISNTTDTITNGSNVHIGGIVYNEMKGALSDADSYFMTRFQQARFTAPSVYSVVSGGDPAEIPNLSHGQLLEFHRRFYHPSNSVTVASGNQISLEENLAALQEYFSSYETTHNTSNDNSGDTQRGSHNDTQINPPSKHPSKSRIECTGPLDPLGGPQQTRMLVSFLANDPRDIDEAFALKMLCELLFEGPAAPFYKALIDSGLGSEYAAGSGYDCSTNPATISVGLQGLDEAKLELVEETIENTFAQVRANVKEHISPERLETVLHQIELGLRFASPNFGLSLVSSTTQSWIHGVDPIAALAIADKVEKFRKMYEQGNLFENLLDRYILNNAASKLCFIMRPDPLHTSKGEQREKDFISALNISPQQIQTIKADSQRLEAKQNQVQDMSCLPCLQIDQVNPKIRDVSLQHELVDYKALKTPFYHRKCSEANGLVHFKAKLPLPTDIFTSPRQILLVPLLLQCLSELGGTARNSAADFDSTIKRFTGGLGFSIHQSHLEFPSLKADLSLILSSHGLERNLPKILELLAEGLVQCNLAGDRERIKMLIASSASALASSIASSGNRFAALKAASAFNSPRAIVSEQLNGLAQAHFMSQLVNSPIDQVVEELQNLKNLILSQISRNTNTNKTVLVHSNSNEEEAKSLIGSFLLSLKPDSYNATTTTNDSEPFDSSAMQQAVFIPGPFSSNFTAMALMPFANSAPSASECAVLTLTAKLLRAKHLHREIREIGGAYGSGASFSPLSGLFTFTSYRDPSPRNSLNVFKTAGEALLTRDSPNEEDLLGAKLSAFSDLDAPTDISSRGLQEFLYGPVFGSDARRQEFRDALRSCQLSQIRSAIEQKILPFIQQDSMKMCVIGEERKIEELKNDTSNNIKWSISK